MEKIKFYLIVIFGWPITGFVIGMITAIINGEHGSIIFIYLGMFLGIVGSITHAGYLILTNNIIKIRAIDPTLISIIVLFCAYIIALVMPVSADDAFTLVIMFGGIPTLVVAYLIKHALIKIGWPNQSIS